MMTIDNWPVTFGLGSRSWVGGDKVASLFCRALWAPDDEDDEDDEFGDDDNDNNDDNCIDMMPACSAVHCGHLIVFVIMRI